MQFERIKFQEGEAVPSQSGDTGRVYDRRGYGEADDMTAGDHLRGIIASAGKTIGSMFSGAPQAAEGSELSGLQHEIGEGPYASPMAVDRKGRGGGEALRSLEGPAELESFEKNMGKGWDNMKAGTPGYEDVEHHRLDPDQVGFSDGAVDLFMAAMRASESDSNAGDYHRVKGMVRGRFRLLGAYGIAEDDWHHLAEDAGIPGARWRDSRAQDRVAQHAFTRLYNKYGDWRWVASAWKAGEEKTDVIRANPDLFNYDQLTPLKTFVQGVMKKAQSAVMDSQDPGRGVKRELFRTDFDDFNPFGAEEFDSVAGYANPYQSGVPGPTDDIEEVLRRRLYAMRDRQRLHALPEGGEPYEPEIGMFGGPVEQFEKNRVATRPGPEEGEYIRKGGRGSGEGIPQRVGPRQATIYRPPPPRRTPPDTQHPGSGGYQE